MRLQNKVVVVTGSTRGIGRAIVEACASEGAAVVISSRHEGAVTSAVEALKSQGRRASGTVADVTSSTALEGLLRHAVETWGRVDVWLNNAGLSAGYRPVDEMSVSEIQELVDTNLTGTIQACRLLVPYFVERRGGILVNMSGRGGRGDTTPYTAVYGATKAAVRQFTLSLAAENRGQPISIHGFLPGMVDTDFYSDDMKTSPRLAENRKGIPYVLKAIGVPVEEVAARFVDVAEQEPGKETGKIYSLFKGRRLMKGMGMLAYYRATGKIKRD